MSSVPVLLDTDVLSAIMRGEPVASGRARTYLIEHRRLTFSVITRYEILRGLLAKQAVRQQQAFEQLCALSTILPLTDEVVQRAASIYAALYTQGTLIGDADILIAATALAYGMSLATNNEAHFSRIGLLNLDNWLRP
jgi:tRNA(fMet)-specific endonuclease VapC